MKKVRKNMKLIEDIRAGIKDDFDAGKITEQDYKRLMRNIN